jgi:hypothetical protein
MEGPKNDHEHEWIPYSGVLVPINPKNCYQYVCSVCLKNHCSHIQIYPSKCNHEYIGDPGLGPKYSHLRACKNCGEKG